MSRKVAVIGAGLFGSIIAAQLLASGHDVEVIDDAREGGGSKPAACLMKPSWFSGLGKEVSQTSLALLDRLYGVQDLQFKVGPFRGLATVHWVPPAKVLRSEDLRARVRSVQPDGLKWKLFFDNDRGIMRPPRVYQKVVVATGVWSGLLVPSMIDRVQGQAGVAFVWPGQIDEPFISPWAPYKQIVAFNRGDGIWVGDGTTIKAERWTADHHSRAFWRCADAVAGLGGTREPSKIKSLWGIRPYAKSEGPCILEEVNPGFWCATGGAKNGTIAAGWCAHEIDRRLQ